MLNLSQRERDRLVVVRQVEEGLITVAEGARRLRLTTRHLRRVLRRFEAEGDSAVIHRGRGRASNRRLAERVRARALARGREEVFRDFGPTLLAEHLSQDPEIGPLHADTLRLWMIEAGLWRPRRRRLRHRRRRPRRAAFGELVLMDTSVHPWLESRSTEPLVLIALLDDATSRLSARFFSSDSGAANRQMLIQYLEGHGRMEALYTDRAGHFQAQWQASRRRLEDRDRALPTIRRALDALGIELILALSPQAKGRIERLFGTLQDRLIKEMRVRKISSLADANAYLEGEFVAFWNERFAVAPSVSTDAHRPLPEAVDLLSLFAETEERSIRNDFTIRYRNEQLQIERGEADPAMVGTRLTVEKRLDGTVRYRWRGRYLGLTPSLEVLAPPQPNGNGKETRPRPPSPKCSKPAPDHPWRQPFPVSRKALREQPWRQNPH